MTWIHVAHEGPILQIPPHAWRSCVQTPPTKIQASSRKRQHLDLPTVAQSVQKLLSMIRSRSRLRMQRLQVRRSRPTQSRRQNLSPRRELLYGTHVDRLKFAIDGPSGVEFEQLEHGQCA